VEIVDLPAQNVRRTFPHEASIASAALSADGRYLATSSGGGVRVWDAVRGTELSHIEDGGTEPAFSKDGRLLATRATDRVRLWLWQPDDLVEEACARLTRNMTCSEWGQYIEDRRYSATCKALPMEPCG
jgi:WD40 repeat protein